MSKTSLEELEEIRKCYGVENIEEVIFLYVADGLEECRGLPRDRAEVVARDALSILKVKNGE